MTPAIEAAGRAGYEVGVVLEEPFNQVLGGNPYLSRIFTSGSGNKIVARLRLLRRIRQWHPDVAVDLHGGSTAAWLTRASGARLRVGYAGGRNRALYNHRVRDSGQLWDVARPHTVQHQLSPLKSLGIQVEPIPPLKVAVESGAAQWARHWFEASGVGRPMVLIHPAAVFETKQWAVEKFAELAGQLASGGCGIVVTAGPGQQALLQRFDELVTDRVATIVPPLPLDRFSALAGLCDLYVGNDTGPTHLAAALGRPIVVVFGSSDAEVWHPWGVPYRLLSAELECIPCPGYYCLHYDEPRCIRSIGVGLAVEAARELLRESHEQTRRDR